MLSRYGETAEEAGSRRADELSAVGDKAGAAVWRRIIDAIVALSNTKSPGLVH
jgi:hypothetical protein